MNVVKLYKNVDEYSKFLNEIAKDEPLTSHQELEKVRDNIKKMITIFELDDEWLGIHPKKTNFVDKVVAIAVEAKDTVMEDKAIDFITDDFYIQESHGFLETLDFINMIYNPKDVSDFNAYLCSCLCLVEWFLCSFDKFPKDFEFNNPRLNSFNNYIKELVDKGFDVDDVVWDERDMIALIFAFTHYNEMTDYGYIERYLSNIEYYRKKMNTLDFNPYLPGWDIMDFHVKAKVAFENMAFILSDDNIKAIM